MWARPYFIPFAENIIEPLNEIRFCSPLIEAKLKNVYDKKYNGHEGFIVQCSQRQKHTMSRVHKKLIKIVKYIDKLIKFKNSLDRSSGRWKNERNAAVSIINQALNYVCMHSIFAIRDFIRNNQEDLVKLFTNNKDTNGGSTQQPKFNFDMDFDHNGNVVTNPTFDEYTIHILNLYESIKKTVVNDTSVTDFCFEITTIAKSELSQVPSMFLHSIDYIKRKSLNKDEKGKLEKHISKNVKKVNDYLYQFKSLIEVHELQTSIKSNFQTLKKCQYERFKQILTKVSSFHSDIDQVPNY